MRHLLLSREPNVCAVTWLPLARAVICPRCESIADRTVVLCPDCGNADRRPLADWLWAEHEERVP